MKIRAKDFLKCWAYLVLFGTEVYLVAVEMVVHPVLENPRVGIR